MIVDDNDDDDEFCRERFKKNKKQKFTVKLHVSLNCQSQQAVQMAEPPTSDTCNLIRKLNPVPKIAYLLT